MSEDTQTQELSSLEARMLLTSKTIQAVTEAMTEMVNSQTRQNELTRELLDLNAMPADLPSLLMRAYNKGAQAQYDEIPSTVEVEIDEYSGGITIEGTVEHDMYVDEVILNLKPDNPAGQVLLREVINDAKADEAYRLAREKQDREATEGLTNEEVKEVVKEELKPEEQTS